MSFGPGDLFVFKPLSRETLEEDEVVASCGFSSWSTATDINLMVSVRQTPEENNEYRWLSACGTVNSCVSHYEFSKIMFNSFSKRLGYKTLVVVKVT
jgi:hypothetical protein